LSNSNAQAPGLPAGLFTCQSPPVKICFENSQSAAFWIAVRSDELPRASAWSAQAVSQIAEKQGCTRVTGPSWTSSSRNSPIAFTNSGEVFE
jgi:hypothetical protein